jgi:V/A-type H+/Na+-transporting ATPase subunit K
MDDAGRKLKGHIAQSIVLLATVMAIVTVVFCSSAFGQTQHTEPADHVTAQSSANLKYGLIAAAVAFGLGAIGAAIAISYVGAAAMGAVAEKPQIAGQALIFVALAEGLVVFGFITALMILGKV